ncbi:beta-carotene isomerase D27, chloroplastic [Rhododendron vialii]|uniref:beta-carotene isomerase D27, chloroplastic n=1 Tax=Rhododendron vialii TaxID=182163 RepID=UPI00265EB007|nr:beta-carotene isomerase D27, chloroplastic [Rhododendron vialii]
MEGRLVMHNIIPFSTQACRRDLNRGKQCLSIVSVLTQPVNDQVGKLSSSKAVYKDNFFELVAINYISKIVQASTGFTNNRSGYDSFVEAATGLWSNFNPVQQHEIVAKILDKAIPRPILAMIRTLLPNSKFTRELFAVFTTLCFAWLIGPNEVRESKLDGRRERNVVHIKKCRFLEESNCVGMCINLCKMPSQKFMKDTLGVPVNMVPNFDDMSCEMVFGQEPPATAEDPAFKQPCYKLCKVNKRHSSNCPR